MWTIFEKSFLPDMNRVADQVAAAALTKNSNSTSTVPYLTRTKSHRQLTKYVCDSLMTVIGSFFGSPFSSTAAAAATEAAVSASSSNHHRMRTSIDDVGSSSSVLAAAALATNSNATAAVQVSYFYG
jgi:hypothetical protein